MSILLQARNLSHQAGSRQVFQHLNLVVNQGDRIGLVGHNGAGKSTLLRLLALTEAPDSGDIVLRRGLRVAQVAQFLPAEMEALTLLEALLAVMPGQQRWRAEALLAEFGFLPQESEQRVGSLSGGQQNRLMFAQAIAQEPDLLLLDEPTNHLDLATMVLFERNLQRFRGACVLVSHDRTFLDSVTTGTAVLRDQRLLQFASPYTQAKQDLLEADEAAARRAVAENREIDALRASAKRLATWGKVYDSEKLARKAKNMEKRVAKLESQRTEISAGSPLDLSLSLAGSKARQVVAIDALQVSVPGRHLFSIADLVIRPGERVALLGHNGVGKSTFVKMLVAACHAADEQIRVNPQTRLGYYDQELNEVADAVSMVDFARARTDLEEQALRQRLIHAGFAYGEHDKRVNVMSGGERARLLFTILSASAPNLLVLDEPTNHIDIEGKEQLEAQLLESSATVLLTSHDRRFLETVATRYLLIDHGRLLPVNAPQAFFESAPRSPLAAGDTSVSEAAEPRQTADESARREATDDVLEQIEALEALLSADRARKPKFQKPKRQAQWEYQLRLLYEKLESL